MFQILCGLRRKELKKNLFCIVEMEHIMNCNDKNDNFHLIDDNFHLINDNFYLSLEHLKDI